MGRVVAGIVVTLAGLVVVGALAIWLFKALLGMLAYLIVGVLVVGGGVYLYGRARRAIGPGTRTRRRIEAASRTYRMRRR
ncbi:MAG: hypothetical protein HKP61_14095 [Dactylosporangium sp.]|nr:hypothetical protein [Dactylosporangium sp.]NNJ62044.1 hypothetical protein [Dactylosporangium sp.]